MLLQDCLKSSSSLAPPSFVVKQSQPCIACYNALIKTAMSLDILAAMEMLVACSVLDFCNLRAALLLVLLKLLTFALNLDILLRTSRPTCERLERSRLPVRALGRIHLHLDGLAHQRECCLCDVLEIGSLRLADVLAGCVAVVRALVRFHDSRTSEHCQIFRVLTLMFHWARNFD
ncbi:hypothetical protein EJ03DRAFT_73066 [Teratosphaeria nubilosa]|uniref:Uncharacterized protein n=1 Tax=Teratosphaeria nubilosa TaxID=161662 RepID=A0A6G1LM75_9PEZI|nr:hypothetical protein EJ03DRAFT_73066 [Teratosphaeria nubilosa]